MTYQSDLEKLQKAAAKVIGIRYASKKNPLYVEAIDNLAELLPEPVTKESLTQEVLRASIRWDTNLMSVDRSLLSPASRELSKAVLDWLSFHELPRDKV
jgi:hypothetical protein